MTLDICDDMDDDALRVWADRVGILDRFTCLHLIAKTQSILLAMGTEILKHPRFSLRELVLDDSHDWYAEPF